MWGLAGRFIILPVSGARVVGVPTLGEALPMSRHASGCVPKISDSQLGRGLLNN